MLTANKSILLEWLDYIQNLSPVLVDLNLDRIREVAVSLQLLPWSIYTVLIGGTNGKGTTCCLLEKILLNNGMRVGLYTSPHLLSYNERIRVCGQELLDDIHIEVFSIIDKARNNILLTYFEFITLSALYIFKRFRLDLVILEVGLGGRLDATNIIDPDVSVITNFEIDHVDLLGNTRSAIAIEKSGIFRWNKPSIIGDYNPPSIINEIARFQGSILFVRGQDWNFYKNKNRWSWKHCKSSYKIFGDLPIPIIPLENAALVLSILYWLPFLISKSSIYYGLQNANLLGRFQIINNAKPLIILDVGHNPHAAVYINKRLSSMIAHVNTIRIVIGMLKNKDIQNTVRHLKNLINVWYCANLSVSLSASVEELSSYLMNCNVQCFSSITYAWKQAYMDSNIDDCILVFGSFYAVSPIIKLILNKFQVNYKYNKGM